MPYISQLSTPTLNHQWDPYQVLNLERDNRCVGWAHTKHRKCLQIVNRSDKGIFHDLVSDISSQPLDATALRPELLELARHGLCLQARHRSSQVNDMVEKWTKSINTAISLAHGQERSQQRLLRSDSTTDSFASSRLHATSVRRIARSPSSTISASTMSASTLPAQSEAESLRLSIAAMQATIEVALRRLDQVESPDTPRIEPARPLERVQTTDISSAYLSTPSLTASSTRISSLRSSSRSSSPARSTSSSHSATSTSSSDSGAPLAVPTQALRRPYSTAATTTDLPTPAPSTVPRPDTTLTAHNHTYSPAITSPQEANTQTPSTPQQGTTALPTPSPTPSPRTPTCAIPHVRRLPLTSSSMCPICYEAMNDNTENEWCKTSCGQSVHSECMDAWRGSCEERSVEARCTMCRGQWEEEECGC